MSQLNVETITNRDGAGAPRLPKGAVVTGVATATTFEGYLQGNATTASNLLGNPNIVTTGSVTAGVVSATTYVGDGSGLSGIVGFATAVSQDVDHFASDFYTATHSRQVPANTQYTVQGNAYAGNTVFTKLGQIHVAAGATFHVANGTNFVMDSLNIFE